MQAPKSKPTADSFRLRLPLLIGGTAALLLAATLTSLILAWRGPAAGGDPATNAWTALRNGDPGAWSRLILIPGGVALAVWGASVGLLARLGRRIDGRIGRLTRRANELVPGPAVKAEAGLGGELTLLEEAFERMAQRVQRFHLESETLNRGLSAKVRQRTEELRQKNLALAFQNEKVIEADRLKSAFFASVSHELRTPLNAIMALSDMLRDEVAGPLNAEQRKHAAMIHSSGENLLNLINEVLDLSRIEAGRMEIRLEEADVLARLAEAVEELRPLAESKGLSLTLQGPRTGRRVRVDGDKTRLVLINLLGNAIKFTAEGGITVRFHLLEDERLLSVEVEDTGPGIAPEHHQQIFLEFHRVETPTQTRHPGTGLGLAVSRQLVNLMRGDIWVDSVVGRGSRFAFVIPVQPVSEPPVSGEKREADASALETEGPGRVLVVGADMVAAGVFARYFRQRNLDALLAREGMAAYQLLQAEPIDLILVLLSDATSPEIDWVEALGRDPQLARIPLVAYLPGTPPEALSARIARHPAAVLLPGPRGTGELVGESLEVLAKAVQARTEPGVQPATAAPEPRAA
ncbi:MAG: ATP-binding protein [Candidatus Eisenbacteria bacterium]